MKRAAFMLLFHVYLERIKQESGLDSLFVLGEKKNIFVVEEKIKERKHLVLGQKFSWQTQRKVPNKKVFVSFPAILHPFHLLESESHKLSANKVLIENTHALGTCLIYYSFSSTVYFSYALSFIRKNVNIRERVDVPYKSKINLFAYIFRSPPHFTINYET